MKKLSLYIHTVRHLRLSQMMHRVRYRLHRPRLDFRAPPPLRQKSGKWVGPCEKALSLLTRDTARFLNETRDISSPAAWNDPAVAKLWLYNLHYFDDLLAADATERREWHLYRINRWIAENPVGHGNGWEPYTLSIRIVNWIKWALAGAALPEPVIASLAMQTRFLRERLEYHLLGNHLLANAKALVFAGTFFAGAEAEGWRRTGLNILRREIPEQILPDGGHFECSPMYHAIILEDFLDIENLAVAYRLGQVIDPAVIRRMCTWLLAMCHPDRDISFFNDAAFGIAAHPEAISQYAARLDYAPILPQPGLTHLAASGYVRVQRGSAVLLADVAPIGPSYLPGHAHADTLSFELSVFGRRVIVNSGTSCYGMGPQRQQQRGTAAHNTVVIDEQDSSEVWHAFRVARRAHVYGVHISETADGTQICAAHDGYRRLPNHNHHRRCWLAGNGFLEITDEVSGRFASAEARFHLHPEIRIEQLSAESASLQLPEDGKTVRLAVEGGQISEQQDMWHPGFGVSVENRCLIVRCAGSKLKTRIAWEEPS